MTLLENLVREFAASATSLEKLFGTDRGDVLFCTMPGGKSAVNACLTLQSQSARTGHWPVIMGSANELDRVREMAEINPSSVAESIEYSRTIDAQKWLKDNERQRLEDFQAYNPGEEATDALGLIGEWPNNVQPFDSFSSPFDIRSRKPLTSCVLSLVPTTTSWEVPAFLHLGGWNECPEAAVHCALHRYWSESNGAAIVCATPDIIEMKIARPPSSRDAAMALAREQYLYCVDIVEQGMQTISNLAAGLLNGKTWYFWWD